MSAMMTLQVTQCDLVWRRIDALAGQNRLTFNEPYLNVNIEMGFWLKVLNIFLF